MLLSDMDPDRALRPGGGGGARASSSTALPDRATRENIRWCTGRAPRAPRNGFTIDKALAVDEANQGLWALPIPAHHPPRALGHLVLPGPGKTTRLNYGSDRASRSTTSSSWERASLPSDSRKAEGRHRGRRSSPSSRRALVVNQESASWLRRGFPWIYPKEILHRPAKLKPGRELQVESEQGQFLGRVIWEGDWIAARCMRREQGALDSDWLRERLESARRYREEILPPETTAWRWIHAENDGLPGIRVDVYGWYLVVTLDGPAFLPLMERMLPLLQELSEARGTRMASAPALPAQPGQPAEGARLIAGSPPPGDVRVLERASPASCAPVKQGHRNLPDMRQPRLARASLGWEPGAESLLPHWIFLGLCRRRRASTTALWISGVFLSRAEANFVWPILWPTSSSRTRARR